MKNNKFLDYQKNDIEIYSKTKKNIKTAIKYAKKLNKYSQEGHPKAKIYELNPYTNVYELIENIFKFKNNN